MSMHIHCRMKPLTPRGSLLDKGAEDTSSVPRPSASGFPGPGRGATGQVSRTHLPVDCIIKAVLIRRLSPEW